jgi:hypothetical protein
MTTEEYVALRLWWGNPEVQRIGRRLEEMAAPKSGGKRDKRLKDNRPKTGAGSQGGRVPRRRPRKK